MDCFVRCYIDTVYSDNLVVSAQRTRHFFDRHPRLLDFRHNSGLLLSLCMSANPSVLSCNTDTTRNNIRTSNNVRTPSTDSLAAPPTMLPALAVQPIRVLHTASTSVQVCVMLAVIDMQLKHFRKKRCRPRVSSTTLRQRPLIWPLASSTFLRVW